MGTPRAECLGPGRASTLVQPKGSEILRSALIPNSHTTTTHHERLRRLCLRGGSASFTSLRVMPAMGTHRSPPAPPQRHPSRARFGASNEEPCSSPKRRSSGPRLTAPREINTAWRTVVGLWELSCHGSSAAFVILPTSTQLPTRKLVSRRRTECAVRCFDTRWT